MHVILNTTNWNNLLDFGTSVFPYATVRVARNDDEKDAYTPDSKTQFEHSWPKSANNPQWDGCMVFIWAWHHRQQHSPTWIFKLDFVGWASTSKMCQEHTPEPSNQKKFLESHKIFPWGFISNPLESLHLKWVVRFWSLFISRWLILLRLSIGLKWSSLI